MADDFKACAADGCNRHAHRNGFCIKHYESLRKYGRLEPIRIKNAGRQCAVIDCDRPAQKRGWCIDHYLRWQRHGEPTAGRVSPKELEAWLLASASTTQDECLRWPFGSAGAGYGILRFNGRRQYAHRAMCTIVHGEPPTPVHYAAHSCGKGHEGCVNPRHLRWATPKENQADMIAHGNSPRGERNGHAKLSEDDVRQIKSMIGVVPYRSLADRFGVSASLVHQIKKGRAWGWLE